jgi:hypothetical protein
MPGYSSQLLCASRLTPVSTPITQRTIPMLTPQLQMIHYVNQATEPESRGRIVAIAVQHTDGTIISLEQNEAVERARKGLWIYGAMIDDNMKLVSINKDASGNTFMEIVDTEGGPNRLLELPPIPAKRSTASYQ